MNTFRKILIAIILLGASSGYYAFQFLDRHHAFLLYPSRLPSEICGGLVKDAQIFCEVRPIEILQQGRGRSTELKNLRLCKKCANQNQGQVTFRPRNDVKPWLIQLPLDWSADPFRDRNWRMQLNAWRPIDNLMIQYSKSPSPELQNQIFQIINDWYEFHIRKHRWNMFAWYDMSAAYRADRLSKIIDWVASSDVAIAPMQAKMLIHMAVIHVGYLTNPKHLSPGNHAIFQLAALHRLCRVAPYVQKCGNMKTWADEEMNKLVLGQFGSDGLHREHSTEYHFFALRIFKLLISEGVVSFSKESLERLDLALNASPWLTAPNRVVPTIGDSAATKMRENIIEMPKKHSFSSPFHLFKETGLSVVRTEGSGLWFYAFHHSTTHKHDDDLAFYLWDNGEAILIDGGKLTYNKDHRRDYVLSRFAHNGVIIPEIKSLSKRKFYGSGLRSMEAIDERTYRTQGEVRYPSGVTHHRVLTFQPGRSLDILDRFEEVNEDVGIHFLISPKFRKTSLKGNTAEFRSKKTTLRIKIANKDCTGDFQRGLKNDDDELVRGWYSPKTGKVVPTPSLVFWCRQPDQEIKTSIEYFSN